MEDLLRYRENRKLKMIQEFDLNVTEEEILKDYTPITYKERQYITIRYKYNWKYHLNEIFNRVLCQEQNKPSKEEIDIIKSRLNNNFQKKTYIKHLTYNQRKHLIYIWRTLNNLDLPYITKEIKDMKEVITMHMSYFFSETTQVKQSNTD